MSTLVENVQKVKNAHAALKTAIAAKGVAVPEGTKLTDMPALVEQISTEPVPTNPRAVFAFDKSTTSIVVPNTLVVDMLAVDDLTNCFYNCSALTSISLPEGFGSTAVEIGACFYNCISLTSLTLPDGFGQNTTIMSYNKRIGCFQNCKSLVSLHLPSGFGRNATGLQNCFSNCPALTTITGNPNFKVSLNLSTCTKLTHDSIMVIINGLQTVTSTQTLTLGSTNLAKLTEADKKIATDKGWTLA